MRFRRPALQAFHSQKGICILKRELGNWLICTAQEISNIAAIELNGTFPQVTFFCSMADGIKNIFVHRKTLSFHGCVSTVRLVYNNITYYSPFDDCCISGTMRLYSSFQGAKEDDFLG